MGVGLVWPCTRNYTIDRPLYMQLGPKECIERCIGDTMKIQLRYDAIRYATRLFFVQNSAHFLQLNLKFCTYFLSRIFNPLHRGSIIPPAYFMRIILINI